MRVLVHDGCGEAAMRATLFGTRLVYRVSIAAIVMVASLLGGAAGTMAADGGSIEIHGRICPVAFAGTDSYNECHDDPLVDVTYTVTLLGTGVVAEATTGGTGNLAFEGLAFGTYAIEESVPGDFAKYRVYCSDQSGAAIPLVSTDTGGVQLDVAVAGQAIVCDWYIMPDNARGDAASVTIYNVVCPAGYRGDDFFSDCYGTPLPGLSFSITGTDAVSGATAVTGSDGFVAFDGISTGGRYVIAEDIPGEFNHSVVHCSAAGQSFPVSEATGANSIALDLTVADDLRCDWYNLPEDLRGDAPVAQPTAPPVRTAPVVRLPDTGGRIKPADHRDASNALVIGEALMATGIGMAAWSVGLRRQQRLAPRTMRSATIRRRS